MDKSKFISLVDEARALNDLLIHDRCFFHYDKKGNETYIPADSVRVYEIGYELVIKKIEELMKKERDMIIDKTFLPDSYNINYYHVVENSHFYTDLDMIIRSLQFLASTKQDGKWPSVEYIISGLQNSIKNGYNLYKTPEQVTLEDFQLKRQCLEAQIKLYDSEIYKLQNKPREGKEL